MFEQGLLLDTESFILAHLSGSSEDKKLVSGFSVGKNALGLEEYLKGYSFEGERCGENRTYLVKDRVTGELVCYFSLRAGLIPVPSGGDGYLSTFPAIELSYFAVNASYRRTKTTPRRIGLYVFNTFILPVVRFAAQIIGARFLYVYALPIPRLILHYAQEMGFRQLPDGLAGFLYERVKPDSDKGCVFMLQPLY